MGQAARADRRGNVATSHRQLGPPVNPQRPQRPFDCPLPLPNEQRKTWQHREALPRRAVATLGTLSPRREARREFESAAVP